MAVGGLLAAAAAVFLMVGRGPDPASEQDPNSPGASASGAAPVVVASALDWTLDLDGAEEAEVLSSILLDGQPVASMEAFGELVHKAQLIEVKGRDVRIRHRKEFVMELADATALRMDRFESDPGTGGARVLEALSGAVRVATGPDFDPLTPLVVETVHVRTQVVGTIFGIDVGDDYTCVCCLEGEVVTTPVSKQHLARMKTPSIFADSTRVIASADDRPPWDHSLVDHHRSALTELQGYWS